MKRRWTCLLAWMAALLLLGGCHKEPTAFEVNSGRMVGVWEITAYTVGGVAQELNGQQIRYTYRADGTGEKTLNGERECVLTYTYDGEHLYTTVSYPDAVPFLRNDLCTATADALTIYSYDEDSSTVMTRVADE